MTVKSPFEDKVKVYEQWFEEYPLVYKSELMAIGQALQRLPENIRGIEVGLGTGQFSKPLGIKEGVEPSLEMRVVAEKKGIEVRDAVAENLPYKDLQFDFVLFVTVCHLDDLKTALMETHRVLKNDGSVIVGFIDRNSTLGKTYEQKRSKSTFYKNANFISVEKLTSLLKETGFRTPEFTQTIFSDIENFEKMETPQDGAGEGGFVVARAQKKPK